MFSIRDNCKRTRTKLKMVALLRGQPNQIPLGVAEHLANCLACQDYQEGLALVSSLFVKQDYYSPLLRQKTLTRIHNASAPWRFRETLLLVLASAASVPFTFLLPLWLTMLWVRSLLHSSLLSLGVSFVVVISIGMMTVLVCSLMLYKRGYFQLNELFAGLLEKNHG